MNHQKESTYLFFLRRFYNITNDLDEYMLGEINRFGNNMFMLGYAGLILWLFLYFFFVIDISAIALFIAFFIPPYYQEKLIKRLELDKVEVEREHLKIAEKAMLKRTLWQTLLFSLLGPLTSFALWRMGIPKDSSELPLDLPNRDQLIFETHFYLSLPHLTLGVTIISFICFYIANRRKIIIID